jgi:hypothetical protein
MVSSAPAAAAACREEVDALASAVKEHGMSLVVFAEW